MGRQAAVRGLVLLLLISCAGATRVVDSFHDLGSETVLDDRGLARPPRQASGKRQGGFTGPESGGPGHGRGAGDSHPRVETALSGVNPLGTFGWLPCPPSKRSAHCPDCDRINSEMCDLQELFLVFFCAQSRNTPGWCSSPPTPFSPTPSSKSPMDLPIGSGVLSKLWYEVATLYAGRNANSPNPNPQIQLGDYFGCDIFVEGNGTKGAQRVIWFGQCSNVPFRSLAHTITAYALNGSDMNLAWTVNDPRNVNPSNPSGRIDFKISIPNWWLVSKAALLNWAINLLPADILAALHVGDEWGVGLEYTRDPSIEEVFTKMYAAKRMEFINATSKSWPWTPPPPPPPPTPPPAPVCPGGSLKACIGLCPDTPMDAQKACIQECMDVCNHKTSEWPF